jgi:hypothetical protein
MKSEVLLVRALRIRERSDSRVIGETEELMEEGDVVLLRDDRRGRTAGQGAATRARAQAVREAVEAAEALARADGPSSGGVGGPAGGFATCSGACQSEDHQSSHPYLTFSEPSGRLQKGLAVQPGGLRQRRAPVLAQLQGETGDGQAAVAGMA